MQSETVFTRIGGHVAVSRLVIEFYERVLDDERLAPFFSGVDMRRLVEHQAKFISSLMGGPASYSDQDIHDIHAHLDIEAADFDALADIFETTIAGHIEDPADAASVVAALRSRRHCLVKEDPQPAEP